ncbi:MAG: hypothetical protein VYC80_04760 [Planctomycetota bacterium]|nr:hypothetical protein [Planctomycetota bacterium]
MASASISVGEFLRGMRGLLGAVREGSPHWWIHDVFSTVTGEFFFIQPPVVVCIVVRMPALDSMIPWRSRHTTDDGVIHDGPSQHD